MEDLKSGRAVLSQTLRKALLFVLGFSSVFIALGASASLLGQVLRANSDIFNILAGGMIVLMGFHFLGLFRLPFLANTLQMQPKSGSAYFMGVAFAFGWTPCIGPILATILALAAQENTLITGVLLLGAYSLGLAVPFMLAALMVNPFLRVLTRLKTHMHLIEKAMGGLLIVTGLLIMTGSFATLAQLLLEWFPALGKLG
jgi:cytochrome c-type biogenesis protein